MGSLKAIEPEVAKVPTAATIVRELALAADRYRSAGQQNDCIALIARIYDLVDDLEQVVTLE